MNNHGFARRDLLALVAVGIVGGAVLYGAQIPRIRMAQATQMISNGKQIYTSLFSQESDCGLGLSGGRMITWPRLRTDRILPEYADSSEFFATLVRSNVLDVSYAFFASTRGDMTPAKTDAEFLDGTLHNVWCVTLDVSDSMKAGAPVLFTQNFKFATRESGESIAHMKGLEPDAAPFGDRGGAVILRGGAGMFMKADTALPTNFNGTAHANTFLWPLASGQALSH